MLKAIKKTIQSNQVLEGGGFPVRRPFPTHQMREIDPFLLFDHMGPVTYAPGKAVGAPDHPHRGFETVTYMLQGSFEHKDSAGNHGILKPGDVQWMTAGEGVVHSEMPQAEIIKLGGTIEGIQLWVNLPAKNKMIPPRYQDTPGQQIPLIDLPQGAGVAKIIAGELFGNRAVIHTHISIQYYHFILEPHKSVSFDIPSSHNAFLYILNGKAKIQEDTTLEMGQLALFENQAGSVQIEGLPSEQKSSVVFLSGEPIKEPVVRYGPFVMNTEEEIAQAMRDYQSGLMGKIRH